MSIHLIHARAVNERTTLDDHHRTDPLAVSFQRRRVPTSWACRQHAGDKVVEAFWGDDTASLCHSCRLDEESSEVVDRHGAGQKQSVSRCLSSAEVHKKFDSTRSIHTAVVWSDF